MMTGTQPALVRRAIPPQNQRGVTHLGCQNKADSTLDMVIGDLLLSFA